MSMQMTPRMLAIFSKSKIRQNAIKNGWRSGLEEAIASDLKAKRVHYEYEAHTLEYFVPSRTAKYTPDFYITTKSKKIIIIESKGRFLTAERQKMIRVKAQHPDLDIRFVFSRSATTISKKSKTTYGNWATKHGFPYADKLIPESWINE